MLIGAIFCLVRSLAFTFKENKYLSKKLFFMTGEFFLQTADMSVKITEFGTSNSKLRSIFVSNYLLLGNKYIYI